MCRALILGYGNPLRGDDGLGWHVASQLASAHASLDAEVFACHQLTPELAEAVSRAEKVIFVDARIGCPPGELAVEKVMPVASQFPASSHVFDPAALLAFARRIYGTSPEGFVLSVVAKSFAYSEELSPEVRCALPELLRWICQLAAHEGSATREARSEITGRS